MDSEWIAGLSQIRSGMSAQGLDLDLGTSRESREEANAAGREKARTSSARVGFLVKVPAGCTKSSSKCEPCAVMLGRIPDRPPLCTSCWLRTRCPALATPQASAPNKLQRRMTTTNNDGVLARAVDIQRNSWNCLRYIEAPGLVQCELKRTSLKRQSRAMSCIVVVPTSVMPATILTATFACAYQTRSHSVQTGASHMHAESYAERASSSVKHDWGSLPFARRSGVEGPRHLDACMQNARASAQPLLGAAHLARLATNSRKR